MAVTCSNSCARRRSTLTRRACSCLRARLSKLPATWLWWLANPSDCCTLHTISYHSGNDTRPSSCVIDSSMIFRIWRVLAESTPMREMATSSSSWSRSPDASASACTNASSSTFSDVRPVDGLTSDIETEMTEIASVSVANRSETRYRFEMRFHWSVLGSASAATK